MLRYYDVIISLIICSNNKLVNYYANGAIGTCAMMRAGGRDQRGFEPWSVLMKTLHLIDIK